MVRSMGAVRQGIEAMLLGVLYGSGSKKTYRFAAPGMIMNHGETLLEALKELIEDNTFRPFIDRTYSVTETPDAIRYIIQEHAQGKVAIGVDFGTYPSF